MKKKIEHQIINGVEGKVCAKCGEWKSLDSFRKDSKNSDGLRSNCKKCDCRSTAKYYSNHREERLQYNKKYMEDNREDRLEYMKQYNYQHYRTLKGFCTYKYNAHLTCDVNKSFFTRDTIPPNYITPQALIELYQQPDFYDGKLYDWSLMSIDRIDDNKPHTFDNIVVCTFEHNRDRHNKHLTVEEYKALINLDYVSN